MDSFVANESTSALIDWNTPEMVKNKTIEEDYFNNPFDVMESKAASMDPYDLVFCQTSSYVDPPCGNILSPLWEPKIRQIRKSVSLTNIDGIAKIVEQNYVELINIDNVEGLTNDVHVNEEIVNQSKESDVLVHLGEKQIDNQEQNIDLLWTPLSSKVGNKNAAFCNEDEKKKIREQTRQTIAMLIEKGKASSRKSLFCTPVRSSESSIKKNESFFDKAFIGFDSNCDGNISNSASVSKTLDFKTNINDNDSSKVDSSVNFPIQELSSFDLDSLNPEWVVDNFSDNDGSMDDISDIIEPVSQPINDEEQVDIKLKFLNRIGNVEPKPDGKQTLLKSMHNKRIQTKGPFLANVPLQHMVQNYEDTEIKEINHKPPSTPRGPIASSTPTASDTTPFKTPTSSKCSIKSSRISSSSRSVSSSNGSLRTPLNATKCIQKNKIDKTLTLSSASNLSNSTYKRSNTTIVLSSQAIDGNTELRKSVQPNRSKSEGKIENIPKLVASNTIHKRLSCLPVSKLSKEKKIFKGKENIK